MKLVRILMLGLGLAVFAGVASPEPVIAQFGAFDCWDCQWGHFPDSGCVNCTIGQSGLGAEGCATPRCLTCDLLGDDCMVTAMLDGRAAPIEQFESPVYTAPIELQALNAAYGSTDPIAPRRRAGEIKRSCDGGIISKSYTVAEVDAIRKETAQLRL
ncbi:hypothetical protein [Candidatus Palauibacter sp.]|uniref:hypothetical protein n=1 Tax=Candidatus Palauibacter sp. TaxID=3101350 RepID=UPI003B5C1688